MGDNMEQQRKTEYYTYCRVGNKEQINGNNKKENIHAKTNCRTIYRKCATQ